jgi:hypothetical protein
MNFNDKDLLEKIKVMSLVIISISIGWIAIRFDDVIDLLSVLANK